MLFCLPCYIQCFAYYPASVSDKPPARETAYEQHKCSDEYTAVSYAWGNLDLMAHHFG